MPTKVLTEAERTVAAGIVEDPRWFAETVLGCHPYEKQAGILEAMRTHRRVSIAGANGSGKDFMAARAILWWMASRYPAKAIVTGPTTRQVNDVIWGEVRAAYYAARYPLGGRMFDVPRLRFGEDHFVLGFSTDNPYNLQGFHSPNLLVVITEAHAMRQQDIDALRRLNPSCFLMLGNPFSAAGEFYDAHHTRRHLYKAIELSAYDTPNLDEDAPINGRPEFPGMVTKQDVADRREEWGEDSPLYISGVLGQFPDHMDDTVVPLYVATEAAARTSEADGPVVVACDVARYGRDNTVVFRRQGHVARMIWRVHGRDTMKIAGWLHNYAKENKPASIVVDDTGVGGGVTDRLRELDIGCKLIAFNGGETAHKPSLYSNAISEAWMLMRAWFLEGGADIENDPSLIGQVSGRQYSYQSDRRIILESKKKMAKSPDEADALAMTFAGPKGGTKVWL